MVLPKNFEAQCYQNESVDQTPGAERPLFALIWAYRILLNGGQPNLAAAQKSLDYIEVHTRNAKYYSTNDAKKKNFQSWYDLVAFEEDDVVTYNQGLLAVALLAAEKMGLKKTTSANKAVEMYKNMFNKKGGYYPLSEKKNLISVDAFAGDLLAQLFFNKPLLPQKDLQAAFHTIKSKLKKPYGFKITALPNGNYAPANNYDIAGFKVDVGEEEGVGNYQWGGSWYLYDMIFLIDAYLHKAPGALDEILWRGSLDFKLGGTYFEYLNTVTGKPRKANQGWNAAVYAIWQKLIDKGLADDKLFRVIDNANDTNATTLK